MSDQWFYRVFGEEFGPMPLEKLKELASSGTVQALDEVRNTSAGDWVPAVMIEELGLTNDRRTVTAVATPSSDFDVVTRVASDEWYCQIGGSELGPIGFDELVEFAEKEQLAPDDHVKLGVDGKWRRAGSIGRLVSVFPYQAVEKKILPKSVRPSRIPASNQVCTPELQQPAPVAAAAAAPPIPAAPDMEATYRIAYEQAAARVAESMMAQADAAYQTAEAQAMEMVAWATKPGIDPYWFGWSNGVEFGPVEFSQVFGLARIGQLKPSDFVRNGQHGQYIPASSLPGVFNAVATMARANEARTLAKSQAQAATAKLAPPTSVPAALLKAEKPATVVPVSAPRSSNPVVQAIPPRTEPKPAVSEPAPEPEAALESSAPSEPVRPAASSGYSAGGYSSGGFSSGGFSSSSTYSSAASRPSPPKPKPAPRRSTASESTWLSDTLESLKEPKAIGSICAIAFVLLIVGWGYLPKSRAADLKRYNALKSLIEEIKQKRTSSPAELAPLEQKLTKLAKEIALAVKDKASREDLAKQNLLWATRDEVPRMVTAGLATESVAEKNFVGKLKEVSYALGLEKRPPVDLSMLAANAERD